ncbi:MAG: hypothetical protein ACK56F_11035, partial [bacterium]
EDVLRATDHRTRRNLHENDDENDDSDDNEGEDDDDGMAYDIFGRPIHHPALPNRKTAAQLSLPP